MATRILRGIPADRAERRARRSIFMKGWDFLREWPVIPSLGLFVLLMLALFANATGFNKIRPSLADRNAPIGSYQDIDNVVAEYQQDVRTAERRGTPIPDRPTERKRYWLGADQFGRDIMTRVMHGARISLMVMGISATTGMIVGTTWGLCAGYFGGWIDELLMRVLDTYYSIPYLLLALVTVIIFGQSINIMLGLLALFAWPPFVRVVRSEVLSLKERDYVHAAKTCGANGVWIMWKHILPNVINTIIVIATLRVGQLILAEAILSFLGAGVPPPEPAWGAMVAEGREYLNDAWWISTIPGLAIFILVMSLNFIGDWFRDRFDPRLRQV